MRDTALLSAPARNRAIPPVAGVVAVLLLLAAWLAFERLNQQLPMHLWAQAFWAPAEDDQRQLILHYSQLPRLVVALLCGATLGLVGCILQHILRNPLAEPTTLGISAGAQLSLTVCSLYAPGLLALGSVWPALSLPRRWYSV